MINNLQIASAFLIAVLYALAFFLGLRHMRGMAAAADPAAEPVPATMGWRARLLMGLATIAIPALLVWRGVSQGTTALPYAYHLDAFLFLALLLAIALIYFRMTSHLGSLSFYLLPMLVAVLLLGIVLGVMNPQQFQNYRRLWTFLHLATIIVGSTCFALACVGGVVYLLAARQLKTKRMGPARSSRFPPLASLEKFNRRMVYFGFPLLTIGFLTGALSLVVDKGAQQPLAKIGLAVGAWVVYAILLPLAPSFRGQRAAWLSIVGFVFILGGYVAATWIR